MAMSLTASLPSTVAHRLKNGIVNPKELGFLGVSVKHSADKEEREKEGRT